MNFAELHARDRVLLLPNAYDVGSARILASMGFEAIATTSSGFAATLGRRDYTVTLEEKLEHARALSAAVDIPVSADFENGFADDPEGVAGNVRRAAETGLAGLSIEDKPEYDAGLAAERVRAAAEAKGDLVLTARCEHLLHGRDDLGEVIERLQAYQEAGADVLYAPGLRRIDDVRAVVEAVDRPVNVLALPGAPTVADLAELGVARISVGGAFAYAAFGAAAEAARELLEDGTYGYWEQVGVGSKAVRSAFGS